MIVSADTCLRELTETSLASEGHIGLCVASAAEALEKMYVEQEWDYLLLDTSSQRDFDALFVTSLIQRVGSEKIIVVSELGDRSWQPFAKKFNISGVLTKPLLRQDFTRLIDNSNNASSADAMSLASPSSGSQPSCIVEELDHHGFFLAACPAMLRMHREIRILAAVDYPLLILGESGVGKEVVARLLHKYSRRSRNEFVNVNTAAIPSELLESELFGYEVGAFTGAVKAKPGKFEIANKGTILLDEIGEMSLQMQAKLLHVLQDGTLSRLGGRTTTQTDVRILAATNVDMEGAISQKRFREDLYYRLNAFTITVPSLRERREEIPMLMEQMIARGFASTGREPQAFSSRLIEAAQEYHWPGNLRELRNFVTRLLVLQDEHAAFQDLRSKTRARVELPGWQEDVRPDQATSKLTLKGVVNDQKYKTESRMIKEALSASGWNRRRAASTLQISYRALLYKIQQHNLTA